MSIARFMQMAVNTGEDIDPNFNQTVLLLHGDGTNGAQNNTFLDSSTNNFTITRVGNTTQGSFSPYYDGWSNYFDGNDYITLGNASEQFVPEAGDFTWETWFYTDKTTRQSIYSSYTSTTGFGVDLNYDNIGDILVYNGNTIIINTAGSQWSINTWTHLAICRSGTTLKTFVNGIEISSITNSTDLSGTATLSIGQIAGFYFKGYLSNLRFVKGTALYTSAFTPSTTPLTAVANTNLLFCQSNRFKDNSVNNYAFTVYDSPSVQPFSPFAPSAAYSTSVNGGSGYFDGTTDALTVPSSSDFAFGTGDFTIEFWGYFTNIDDLDTIYNISGVAGTPQIFFVSGKLRYNNYLVAGVLDTATTITKNTWIHVALVRFSGTTKWYLNGVQDASVADSINWVNTGTLAIGRDTVYARDITGYLSDLRVVKGSAVYTSAFTPPTAPLSAVTNTKLLLNFQNAGIFDNTGKNNLETVADAQIDTATKKYGTGSMEFDGTGDYLDLRGPTENFTFGTGDFTIEFWMYLNSTTSGHPLDFRPASTNGAYPTLYITSNTLIYYVDSSNRITSGSLSTSTWYHVAVSRSGTSTKMFIDGTQSGSTYTDSTNYLCKTNGPRVGASDVGTGGVNGFIDDLRITKGVARYTTTFTPPSRAFPNL